MTQSKKPAPANANPQVPDPDRFKRGLAWALFQFKQRFKGVEKKRYNKFTSSYFANLDDVIDAARPLMDELFLSETYQCEVSHGPGGERETTLHCTLLHLPSGEMLRSSLPVPEHEAGAQVVGSFMTYWKRYLICGLLSIIEAGDDDGNAAVTQPNAPAPLTENQHSQILDYVEATGTKMGDADTEGTLLHHIHLTMNVDSIEDMTSRQAATILKMLKTKYARQQKEAAGG